MMSEDAPGEPAAGHLVEVSAGAVAITGGAWSPSALRLVGLKNLSEPIRRQICLVDNRATNLAAYGMIVDTSGVYFHNDGAYILAGYSPPEEPAGYHFNYDGERFFMDEIWPRLYARMSAFERLQARPRMGRAVRSVARSQRDRRSCGAAGVRGAFVQRTRRDAIVRRRPGAGRVDRDRTL